MLPASRYVRTTTSIGSNNVTIGGIWPILATNTIKLATDMMHRTDIGKETMRVKAHVRNLQPYLRTFRGFRNGVSISKMGRTQRPFRV